MKAPRFSAASARRRGHFTRLRGRGVPFDQARRRARLPEITAKRLEAWNRERFGDYWIDTRVAPSHRSLAVEEFAKSDAEESYQGNAGLGPMVIDGFEFVDAPTALREVRLILGVPEGRDIRDYAKALVEERDRLRREQPYTVPVPDRSQFTFKSRSGDRITVLGHDVEVRFG